MYIQEVPETETRREIDRRLVLVLKRQGMRRVLLPFGDRRRIRNYFVAVVSSFLLDLYIPVINGSASNSDNT